MFFWVILAVACGIPYAVILYSPIDLTQSGDLVSFEHDTRNDILEFQSYLLYYKLYRGFEESSLYNQDKQAIEGNSQYDTDILTDRSFRPIVVGEEENFIGSGADISIDTSSFTRENIEGEISLTEKSESIVYQLRFSEGDELILEISQGNSSSYVKLRRNTSDANNPSPESYKKFTSYTDEDEDIRETTEEDDINITEIAFALIPLGITTAEQSTIYGLPILLAETLSKNMVEE